MFFIGGITNHKEEVAVKHYLVCDHCFGTDVEVFKTYNCPTFFFIPISILKWSEKYYSVCKDCGEMIEYPDEHFRNGKVVRKGKAIQIKCPSCGSYIDSSFQYCPHCGQSVHKM